MDALFSNTQSKTKTMAVVFSHGGAQLYGEDGVQILLAEIFNPFGKIHPLRQEERPPVLQLIVSVDVELLRADLSVFVLVVLP